MNPLQRIGAGIQTAITQVAKAVGLSPGARATEEAVHNPSMPKISASDLRAAQTENAQKALADATILPENKTSLEEHSAALKTINKDAFLNEEDRAIGADSPAVPIKSNDHLTKSLNEENREEISKIKTKGFKFEGDQ